jgi:hypothetical protein
MESINEELNRQLGSLLDTLNKNAIKRVKDLTDFFIMETKKLDSFLKIKMEEYKKLTNSQNDVEKKLKENNENLKWLNDFSNRLVKILEI